MTTKQFMQDYWQREVTNREKRKASAWQIKKAKAQLKLYNSNDNNI